MDERNGDFWTYLVRYRISQFPQAGVWEIRHIQDTHGYCWVVEHVTTGTYLCGRGTGKSQPHFWGPESQRHEYGTLEMARKALEGMLLKTGLLRVDDRERYRRKWREIPHKAPTREDYKRKP